MTFKEGKTYRDSVGRPWWVTCKRTVGENTVMSVSIRYIPGPWVYSIAVVDKESPDTAVLLEDGITTIYADCCVEEEE